MPASVCLYLLVCCCIVRPCLCLPTRVPVPTPRLLRVWTPCLDWRGRQWGPMNMLVYLGLERYSAAVPAAKQAMHDLARQSEATFLGQ